MTEWEHEITELTTWIEIDGNNGSTFIPADVAPDVMAYMDDETSERILKAAAQYYDGSHIYHVGTTEGYGARLTAPGYMDYTEWSVFDSQEAAEQHLRDTYPEDEEEDSEEV